ncbi:MAG: hypothetical protein ACI4EV_01625 [Lachnospiraceae bacterium]
MKSHEEVFKNVIRRRDNGEKIVKATGNRWQPWVGLAACATLAVIVSYIAFTSVEPVKDLKAEPESEAVNDSVSYMFNWDDVIWGKSGEGYDEVVVEWGYVKQDNRLKINMALFEVLSSCPGEAIVAMGVSYAPHSSQIVDETDERYLEIQHQIQEAQNIIEELKKSMYEFETSYTKVPVQEYSEKMPPEIESEKARLEEAKKRLEEYRAKMNEELIRNLSVAGYAVEKNGTVFFFTSPNRLKELNFDGVEDCYFFLATKEQFYK